VIVVLTVAYCRVSTEEQATEGFSIDGQAEKLRAYASLHDLGEVTVIADPGRSGKDVDRAGLQQLLAMVEAGHVAHVLLWRLDRLSRNLGDLIDLADSFGRAGVALHSFTEKIDLSSATGRMFYNILGSFAQFYREQLAENVRMGMQQAAHQGRWMNRPKTGYDLVGGELIPNGDAERVREIFKLRAAGMSYAAIEDRTGIRYSTVCAILGSRIYLGEVLLNGAWFLGNHQPLITPEEFEAAHLGHVPGRRRGRDLLSGRVFCGLCGKRMAVEQNGVGRVMYRCRHRGNGCDQPRRTNKGLHLAARLGLRLLAQDRALQAAIREELRRTGRTGQRTERRAGAAPPGRLAALSERRRKLLELYYADRISGEGFAEEEGRIARDIELARQAAGEDRERSSEREELLARFEEVAALLQDLDLDTAWDEATELERRVLVEELVEKVAVFPDHLEVTIAGAPRLNVGLAEVGLGDKQSQNVGVGGPTRNLGPRPLEADSGWSKLCRVA
jgi:site-specific DNA recombinase